MASIHWARICCSVNAFVTIWATCSIPRIRWSARCRNGSCRNESLQMPEPSPLSLRDLQALIQKMYGAKDVARGVDGTFMWLMEEVGELAAALREGTPEELAM